MDAATTAALKAKYPGADLILLKSKSAEVVAKVSKVEVDLFRELISAPATKARAMDRFVKACIVHPEPDEVVSILSRKPSLAELWGDKLLDAAGSDEEVEAKKL